MSSVFARSFWRDVVVQHMKLRGKTIKVNTNSRQGMVRSPVSRATFSISRDLIICTFLQRKEAMISHATSEAEGNINPRAIKLIFATSATNGEWLLPPPLDLVLGSRYCIM